MRWIVDAMNVVGSRPDGWWRDRGRATARLLEQIARWASEHGEPVTVVLERPPLTPLDGGVVDVAWAPAAAPNSADDEIVRLVGAAADPAEVVVVTSDGELARRVRLLGAAVRPAGGFRDLLDRS